MGVVDAQMLESTEDTQVCMHFVLMVLARAKFHVHDN